MTLLDSVVERALRVLEGRTPHPRPLSLKGRGESRLREDRRGAGAPRRVEQAAECAERMSRPSDRWRGGTPGPGPGGVRPDSAAELAGELAGRLLAEEWARYGWLDVGLWGRPVYKAAAQAALRLQAVAVMGDEIG